MRSSAPCSESDVLGYRLFLRDPFRYFFPSLFVADHPLFTLGVFFFLSGSNVFSATVMMRCVPFPGVFPLSFLRKPGFVDPRSPFRTEDVARVVVVSLLIAPC